MNGIERRKTPGIARKAARVPVLLALALTVGSLGLFGGNAQAALGPCRSDPVVVLSNLKIMDISATISDDSSDLKGVTYTMHLPKGVQPVTVIPTDGLVGRVEHFAAYSDQPAGVYKVTTYAATGKTVPVSAVTLGILSRSATSKGYSNQNITVTL